MAENNPKSVTAQDKPVWSEEESKYLTDLDKANKVVVALSSVPNTTFTADQLAATTFESIRRVMQEYQAKHGGYELEALPEAYLVIPPDFNASQRSTIILAARRAGIQVLKLIEEPIAALYGVRRLENFGWYSVTDFGDTLKHYVVRVFDGEPDLCEETYTEIPEVLTLAERAFYNHLVDRLPASKHIRPWKNEMVKIFDAARDCLMDEPEYVIPDSSKWMRSSLPYISREARQLASFYSIRNSEFDAKIFNAISKVVGPQQVTHPVLIGGNSLAYPEVATNLEHLYGTRLADTITDPSASLALGAAMKAAEDLSYTRSILRGRDVSLFGHPILATNYVDTLHHHLHLSKHHVPLASTLNFGTLATYGKIEPLLPAFHEDQLLPENTSKPYPAISYAHLRDPFSGELEHWARVSIQVPKPPPAPLTDEEIVIEKSIPIPREFVLQDPIPDWLMYEMFLDGEPELTDIQPDMSVSFVLNLTASPLYDTSRNVEIDPARVRELVRPTDSIARTNEAFVKVLKDNPDRPQYRDVAQGTTVPEDLNAQFQENIVDILEKMQEHKDSHSRFYRVQNRAHDLVQSIMSNLRPNDHYSMLSTGNMAQAPLLRPSTEIPRQLGSAKVISGFSAMKTGDHEKSLERLTQADITGRASSKYVDAITLAHENFLEHIEARNSDTERDLKNHLRDLQKAMEDYLGPGLEKPDIPKRILTDNLEDLPKTPWSKAFEDPADWAYRGITPGVLLDWYQLYSMAKYEVSEKGSKEIDEALKSLPPEEVSTEAEQREAWERMLGEVSEKTYHSDTQRNEDQERMIGNFKFLNEILSRMDARKTLKSIFGHQHRMVIITDSIPDADQLKEIESALQRATRDNVSATFISIDGTPFDGPFMQMIARVKGAKAMRFYRKHLWNNDHIESIGKNSWHNAFNEDAIRNLAVKIDFPGYTIDKVYGGWMTPEEKARLEMQKTTSTIRLKIGSLGPSYDIIPGPTPLEADPTAMLVKLKPKEGHNDAMRSTDPDWLYDPESTTSSTALTSGSRLKPSAHTPIAFDITWNDRVGTKHNEFSTLRLTDFNSPVGYFDEPGIARLVRNAKFVEFMRKMLHVSIQDKLAVFDSDVPILEVDNHTTGIQFMGQKQENTLLKIYDESRQSVIRLANERLLSADTEGPIPKQYHKLMTAASHLFDIAGIRIQGELGVRAFDIESDIVSRLLRSYMQASNIAPLSMFARWKGQVQATFEAAEIARLEDPNYVPTSASQSSQVTLKTLLENMPALDRSLPLPTPVHTPKFHGLLLEPHEKNPLLDRRNSVINAQRMQAVEMFPRSEMAPVDATTLWSFNSVMHGGSDAVLNVLNYTELHHRDDDLFDLDEREVVKNVVGPTNWPDYERLMDHRDQLRERERQGLPILVHDPFAPEEIRSPYDAKFLARMLNPFKDEKVWVTLLTTLAKKTEKLDRLREKNAILGPSLVPISELRRYYNEVVAPHQSPDEIARALEIFKRVEKKNAKGEREIKKRSELFNNWYSLLEKERSHPNSSISYAISLIDKARQEDIDEATRNHALGQLDSLEQQAIDSNSVLLKHLMENREVLNSVQSSLQDGSTDTDIVRELEKHLPEGFLESALSKVTRITVPDRGVHPSQVDNLRIMGSEEGAFLEEQVSEGLSTAVSQERLEADSQRKLYAKLYREVTPRYKPVFETSDSSIMVPLEVHMGNVPIDWEDRFERLQRKARAVVRSRVFREDETRENDRERFRKVITSLAQRRVDHRIFLIYASRQMEELELSMSDLPYTDAEEYQRRLDALKIRINPDEYAILVYGEYRRAAQAAREGFDGYVEGLGALIPYLPKQSAKLVDLLEKHNILSATKAHQYRDPIGYLFEGGDPRDGFHDLRVDYQDPTHLTAAEHTMREVWEDQVVKAQDRAKAGASDVFVQPSEGGLTVSTGDSAYADTSEQAATEVAEPGTETAEAVAEGSEEVSAETSEGAEAPLDDAETVQIGGDIGEDTVIAEDSTPKEPIYSDWKHMTKDPWTKEDFPSGLDYHIYRTQNALEPYPRDSAEIAERKAQVSFDILDFLTPNGAIDWEAVKVRRMQYPSLPTPQRIKIVLNDTYEDVDNLGRKLHEDDLNERELTKAEVEAVSSIDIDTDTGLIQSQKTLASVRLRVAEEARRKEKARLDAIKYEPFNLRNKPLDPILAASLFSSASPKPGDADSETASAPLNTAGLARGHLGSDAAYNPLRDGWDQEKYEEYMARTYDVLQQAEWQADKDHRISKDKLEAEHTDAVTADLVRLAMVLPGPELKTMLEFTVQQDKINREQQYSNTPYLDDLWSTKAYSEWLRKDKKIYEGNFSPYWDWLYLKLGSWRIPFLPVIDPMAPVELRLPAFNRLRLNPPNIAELFDPSRNSIITYGKVPTPLLPTYVDPKLAKEQRVMDDLTNFPKDRYIQAVRKAYEKYHGLANSRSKARQLLEDRELEDELEEKRTLFGATPMRVVAPAETAVVDFPIATESERITEAARLTRLGLKLSNDSTSTASSSSVTASSSSSSSKTPSTSIQASLKDFTSTVPGSTLSAAPRTLRERWEHAKQFTLDHMIRDHALKNESANFDEWSKELEQTGVAPSSLVKYPTYAPITETSSLLGLPGVSVRKVVSEIRKERKERAKVARKVLKEDLQRAYRDAQVDAKRVAEALATLAGPYDQLIRRRMRRMSTPVIDPHDWFALLKHDESVGEESPSDIAAVIDTDLAARVFAEQKVPGADPLFWERRDSKSVRQQKKLNALLTHGTPEAIAKWEQKMDDIHDRRIKLSEQIYDRKAEIVEKRLRVNARSIFGNVLMDDLLETNFFGDPVETMFLQGLDDLDKRAANPDHDWEPRPWEDRHIEDMRARSDRPDVYTRLANMVEESLKANAPAEEEEFEDPHGHGGHGGH